MNFKPMEKFYKTLKQGFGLSILILCLTVFSILIPQLYGQVGVVRAGSGAITGQVTNLSTGSPVSGASITYTDVGGGGGGSGVVLSDAAGNYTTDAVPTSTYSISISATGYFTTEATLFIDNGLTLNVNLTPNPQAGATLSESTVAVTEGSTTDTYTIVLDTQPTNDVVIALAVTGLDVIVSTSEITFTNVNWDTPQTITVTAVDDNIDEVDGETDTITHIATSDDANYNGVEISDVTATVTDNDVARRRFVPSDVSPEPIEPVSTLESPVIVPATIQAVIVPGISQSVSVGKKSHVINVSALASDGSVNITVQSDPVTITLKAGEEALIDTDTDGEDDMFIKLDSATDKEVTLTLSSIEDLEFSINKASFTTNSREVLLYFNSPEASMVAISNTADFSNSLFESLSLTKPWILTEGSGVKTVYVTLKTTDGETNIISDTITLKEEGESLSDVECTVEPKYAYKSKDSSAVYYVTDKCTKRIFQSPDVYFSYFDSWDDVEVVENSDLDKVLNDDLYVMPWESVSNPKYGALVKVVTDSKVYLVLGTNKHWITSEKVFTSLKYVWSWVEDVSADLLENYISAGEIDYTDHHPNYTLIKYPNDSKVYMLEADPVDSSKQVKRYIPNKEAFLSFDFRWDRIVTIDETEVYDNGEDLIFKD